MVRFKRVIFILIAVSMPTSFALAQDAPAIPTDKFFEYSINALDETAQSLEKQNQQLKEIIKQYWQDVQVLQQKSIQLERDRQGIYKDVQQLNDGVSITTQKVSIANQKVSGLKSNHMQINNENNRLEKSFQEKQKENTQTTDLMQQLRKEIVALTDKLNNLTDSAEGRFQEEKNKTMQALKESQRNVGLEQRKLSTFKKGYGKPLKMVEESTKQQFLLKQKLAKLEGNMAVLSKENEQLGQDIVNTNATGKSQLEALETSLQELGGKKTSLENVLATVDKKLGNKSVPAVSSAAETQQLEQNLVVIKSENEDLKGQYNKLMGKLKELEKNNENEGI